MFSAISAGYSRRVLWFALAAALCPGVSFAQTTSKPAEPYAEFKRDAELEKKTTAELIDALEKMKHPTLDVWSNMGREFPFKEPDASSKDEKPVYPPFAELTRRGLEAVPELLKHLDDKRITILEEVVESTSHEATVGDLCYCALGQILNEEYRLVTYRQFSRAEIKSPTSDPKLAKSVREKWRAITAAEHQQLLVKAAFDHERYIAYLALRRLCVYYPNAAEETAVQLLSRPWYDWGKLCDFVSVELRKQPDESKWEGAIETYVRESGEGVRSLIPIHIDRYLYKSNWESTPAERERLAKVMQRFFPKFDRAAPARSNVVTIDDQTGVIRDLRFFRSSPVDAAVHALFLKGKDFKFADGPKFTQSEYYLDEFSKACFNRLKDTKYGNDYRAFFLAKVTDLERQTPRDWRKIDIWHELATGKRKSLPPTPEQRQAAAALRALDLAVDGWIEGEIEYGDQVHFFPGDEKKPFPVAAFPHIAKLTELRELWLGGPEVTDAGLVQLTNLSKLEDVRLENTTITSAGLAKNEGLRVLDISNSAVDDAGLAHVAKFERLEELTLAGTRITGKCLTHLRGLKNLKKLNLTGCRKIADGDLANLAELGELTDLTLDGPEVGDDGLKHLYGLAKLEDLTLLHCRATPQGITALRMKLPKTKVAYYGEFQIKETSAGVLLTTPQLTVLLDQATLPIDREFLSATNVEDGEVPGPHLTKDGISGHMRLAGGGSFSPEHRRNRSQNLQ